MISALQLDVKTLKQSFPGTQKYFEGENCIFTDFNSKPWEAFKDYSPEYKIADMQLFDIQNCGLYKKSVFDKIGYTDVNFFPAYFIDNDYARRIINSGIKCCALTNARFFHFWSRTIHQGTGGSTSQYFENNRKFYSLKWHGDFGKEKWKIPFNGEAYLFPTLDNVILPGSLKISDRNDEEKIVDFWKRLVTK
jgi:GT2 family glycosyltransferase